ncbi:hypothetical protein vseg_016467 [Gypsophila vaccaria]
MTTRNVVVGKKTPRTCLCSPTNHPGSFRCQLHRNTNTNTNNSQSATKKVAANIKEKSMKAMLLQLIKPSSHNLRRRGRFQAQPTRFYLLNLHNYPRERGLGLLVS